MSFPEIRIVEASAGSGKTFALAKRYIQLLFHPSLAKGELPLRNILAITFTNKATIEMKERILEFLKKIALDQYANPEEEKELLASLEISRETARQRAFDAMDSLLRNFNFFQVQTIDSFVNAIVSGCAYSLNLSSRFEIKESSRDYLSYSLDAVIERSLQDTKMRDIFTDFLTQYLHVENKPGWFAKNYILAVIQNLYSISNTYGGNFIGYTAGRGSDIIALKKNIIQKMGTLYGRLPAGTNKTFAQSLASFCEKNQSSFSIEGLSSYFTGEFFPINKGFAVPKEIEKLWDTIRHAIGSLSRAEAYSFYNCFIDVFHLVADDASRRARRDDVLFLAELNRRANELFSQGIVDVPQLYYRLAARLRHFLIDEFQDTSLLQWKNLLPMVEEALASGGTLFYVGDKKQAIYRFRGGDATLFDRVPQLFNSCTAVKEVLENNYRSGKEIVEFNNEVFSGSRLRQFIESAKESDKCEMLLRGSDIAEILAVFSDSKQIGVSKGSGGYVKVQWVEGKTVEQRNETMREVLAFLAANLRERFAWRDIAILARDNKEVELITGWLVEQKVPVESEKTLNVRENALVKELVSLLAFLESPIDTLSFTSFLLSDIFISATGKKREEMTDFILQRRGERSEGYLYTVFRGRYPELWDGYIEEFFVNVGYVPAYELAVSILGKFKVMEHFPEQQVFIRRFLELIKDHEQESTGIDSFLRYFKEAEDKDLYVTTALTSALKVLTIHKAKGLEFPVVIVPFLEMRPGFASHESGGSFEVAEGEEGLSLVHLNKHYAQYDSKLQDLYAEKYKKSFIDELDAVYVALTRAKSELYAFIPERSSTQKNLVRLLIQEDIERGTPLEAQTQDQIPMVEQKTPAPPRYENWISLLKEEFSDETDIAHRADIQRGEYAHYALSNIGDLTGKVISDEVSKAVEKSKRKYPQGSDSELTGTLHRILGSAALHPFFFAPEDIVYVEKDIVDVTGASRRLDRLIVGKNSVVVMDYKSSREGNDAHRMQVQQYMRIVAGIYPLKTICGFILYLDSAQAEEVKL